jgi:small conductance mechanosensitive channel
MTDLAAPSFADSWPEWARFLMGTPLRIVIILISAWITLVVVRYIIKHTLARIAKRPGRRPVVSRVGLDAPDLEQTAARREARFLTLSSVFRSTTTVAVWILTICLVLESLGVNPGVIMTSIGVVGVGLGLGAQSLVKDMLAGLLMLIEDQYGIGDLIDAGPATGLVEAMSLRVTTIRDESGVLWYVPNGTITRIGNKTQA